MKILHLPDNIGGMAWALAEQERRSGHSSRVLSVRENSFGYHADETVLATDQAAIPSLAQLVRAFLRNRKGFDVYHFSFGSSLLHMPRYGLNLFDLPFYDKAATRIFTFSGCDARQKYPTLERIKTTGANAACLNPTCYGGVCNSGARDKYRRAAIEKAARHADHFFALNPDLMHFLPPEMTSFCPYVIPDLEKIKTRQEPFFTDDKVHFVHAPTDRAAKGTEVICRTMAQLEEKYPDAIRFSLIENLPRSRALELYRTADVMIDQIMIGWYGGVAVEVMKSGIPVACYIEESDLQFVPEEMRRDLPIYRVSEDTLFTQLEKLLLDREQIPEMGAQASAFVDKWHNPERISQHIQSYYSGSPDPIQTVAMTSSARQY